MKVFGTRWSQAGLFPIEVHPWEGRISPTVLLQCVIPAARIFITEGGYVDAWGGLEELVGRPASKPALLTISLLTDPQLWKLNPQYQAGSNGQALGILVWINGVMLLRLVANKLRFKPLPTLHEKSLGEVKSLLKQAKKRDAEHPSRLRLLFGARTPDAYKRFAPSFIAQNTFWHAA